jgi:hypothetical protein
MPHSVNECYMERINWNLKWIADNAVLCLLWALVFIPAAWAFSHVLLLLIHGKSLNDFPLGLWLLESGIQTAGWATFVFLIKFREDKKKERRKA